MRTAQVPALLKLSLAAVFTVTTITAIIISLTVPSNIEASSTKTLKGTIYKTPSGDIVEIVEVPGFGKCFITAVMMYCK